MKRVAPNARDYQCSHCGEFLFDEQVLVDMPTDAELKEIRQNKGRLRRGGLIECFDKFHWAQGEDEEGYRCGPVQPLVCYRSSNYVELVR